ncbi:MAG: phage holin family protein [Akkermansiaceae bacterium]|nr:phage holin family protein [Verrucomicrobiales bacterium]
MDPASNGIEPLAASPKRFARRLVAIGENRLELFMVEVQEERERLLHAILLSLGAAMFGLLAGITLTAAVVVLVWYYSPVVALLTLTGLYAAGAVSFHHRFTVLLRDWQSFSATLDQLRKDHACFGKDLI